MPESKIQPQKRKQVFLENPYDIETVFESLSIASDNNKELVYMDKFIASIRSNPLIELADLNYNILKELNILK